MRDILERALGAPVLVENDVNLAVLGEHWQGAARGHDTCAFVFVGTGIGAGILIDGELHRGHSFMAGEIAVMCMGPQYAAVDYGTRGCLETLAGLQALAGRWPRGAKGDPEEWMAELYKAAEAGDQAARRAVDETATLIGIAVANVAAVLDPSLVVLGGALMAQGGPLVAEVRKVVERIARAPVELAVSALGKDAPLGRLPAGGGHRGAQAGPAAPRRGADREMKEREMMKGWRTRIAGGALLALIAASGRPADGPTVQERLGHPASARLLILHADDLGMSRSVNRATFEALEKGWITSASVLVPCPWFPDVARWAKAHPEADLGIHLALNSEWTGYRWGPLSSRDKVPSLLDPDGYLPLEETAVVARAKPAEVEAELRAQVDKARAAGVRISHLDSHMATLFRTPELFAVYRGLGVHLRPAQPHRAAGRARRRRVGVFRRPAGGRAGRPRDLHQPRSDRRRLAGGLREDAGAAAARRVSAHRPPRLRRRGDAGRHLRPSQLGRGLEAVRPRPREEPVVPRVPEEAGLRARDLGRRREGTEEVNPRR